MVVWVKEREGLWAIAKIVALSFSKERVGAAEGWELGVKI